MDWKQIKEARARLETEIPLHPWAPGGSIGIALVYPSPYHVAMSSLGFQTLYRIWNAHPDVCCERSFLPDRPADYRKNRTPLFTYESQARVNDFDLVAFSVAYELELTGVFDCLDLAGIPAHTHARTQRHPLIVMGGPLTFSNPLPLGPFADVIIMGEAEQAASQLVEIIQALPGRREDLLQALSALPGFYVPSVHGERLPGILSAPNHLLPASSSFITPETELSNMFLVEAERGCSRGCTFCVMRRSTNGGMRLVTPEKLLALIPDEAPKVGLVGAAVSDHPQLTALIEAIIKSGRGLGLSSLRADKMTPALVALFRKGGYRQLTVASDGASQRLRIGLERRIQEKHLIQAATAAAQAGMASLKLYMMVGVPGETEEDIDELIAFSRELSQIIPLALGVSPFVAKRNTPLDGSPFEDIQTLTRRLKRIARGIRPRAELRSTSARWAWVEYRLAQGGWNAGEAAFAAWQQGGAFNVWKESFQALVGAVDPPWRRGLPPPASVLGMSRKERIQPSQLVRADELEPNPRSAPAADASTDGE